MTIDGPRRLRMIDLFGGLGGASQCMRERGWDVTTVDVDPSLGCDVVADLLTWVPPDYGHVDLVWASPPCQEFSRWGMPWLRKMMPPVPSLALVKSAYRIIETIRPVWWIVENVQGAIPFITPLLGQCRRIGAACMWGVFPPCKAAVRVPAKQRFRGDQRALRSAIPWAVSDAVERAVRGGAPFATSSASAPSRLPPE